MLNKYCLNHLTIYDHTLHHIFLISYVLSLILVIKLVNVVLTRFDTSFIVNFNLEFLAFLLDSE
jgi:hypothetical protein